MTVKELIDQLQQCPDQNVRAIVPGYESGVDDLTCVKIVLVRFGKDESDICGDHCVIEADEMDETDEDAAIGIAVLLHGRHLP